MSQNVSLEKNKAPLSPDKSHIEQEAVTVQRGEIQRETRTEVSKLQTVRDLQDLAETMTPESLPKLEASVQEDIDTLETAKLPSVKDKEAVEKYEQFQVGSALLLLKIAKIALDKPELQITSGHLENPSELFTKVDLATLGLSPLEQSLFKRLQSIWTNKSSSPEVWENIFGEWKVAIHSIQGVAEKSVAKKVQQPTSFTEVVSKAMQDPKVLTTGGIVIGGILLWKMLKGSNIGNDNQGLFSLGGLTKLLFGGAAVLGTGALLSGNIDKFGSFFQGIQSWFSQKPANHSTPSESQEVNDGIARGPIKEVWKNYATDLKAPLTNLEVAARGNNASLLVLLAKFSSFSGLHSILSTGAGLSLSTAVTLAKAPFALVHGAHPGMLLLLPFIAAGGVHTLDEVGNIEVPKDKENLIKDLRKKYETYVTNNPQLELPQTVDDTTLEAMSDIMLGKKRLGDYYQDAESMLKDLPKNAISKVAATPERLVADRNAYHLNTWKKHLSQFEGDAEKKESYLALQNEISALSTILKNGGKLTRAHLENISKIITGHDLPLSMVLEGDFISVRVPRQLGSNETKVFNIAINPDLPSAKQHNLLKSFVLEPESNMFMRGSQSYFQSAWDGMRTRLPDFNRKEKADPESELGGEIAKGNAVMVMVGDTAYFYFKNVKEYFTMPFSLVAKLPKLVTGSLSAEEFTGTLGWSIFPGLVVGTTKEVAAIMKEGPGYFKNGHFLGKVIKNIGIRGVLAPVTAVTDIVSIARKSLYMHDVVRDQGVSELLIKNPKLYLTSRMKGYWTGKMATLHSEKYGALARTLRALPTSINTEVATQYAHLHEIHQITTKLSEAKFNTKNRIALIQQADAALTSSGRLEEVRKKFGTVNPSNLEEVLKETVQILQDEELKLKNMKIKSTELAKTKDPVRKKQLIAEIKELETSKNPLSPKASPIDSAPASHIEKKAYKTPKEALQELRHLEKMGGNLKNTKEVIERLDDIDTYLTKWSETINGRTDLQPLQKQAILDSTVNTYAKRVQGVRTKIHAANVHAFDALPKSGQTADLARQVNGILETGEKSLTKVVLDGAKGRGKLFALEFATLLTVQKGIEVATDPLHSFENAIASVATKETWQLLVDLLPLVGTASNFSSVVTGKEFITGHETSRLLALGWGVINLGQDAVAFIPVVGQAFRSGVFMTKLAELVHVGKLSPEFFMAMKNFPDLVQKHGDKAWKSLFRGLQSPKGAQKVLNRSALAMTGITVGDMLIKMGSAQEVHLAVAKV